MKIYQIDLNTELTSSVYGSFSEFKVIYQYPETEYNMASGGSSQVLGDFLEFTDYLTPFKMSSRYVKTDDYFTTFNSL